MDINELITSVQPGAELNISNTPFSYTGTSRITLDSGDVLHWLYSGDERLLAIAPTDEELIIFTSIDEEMEPDGTTVLYQGKEHEFSYEDTGVVTYVDGELNAEEEDRVSFSDYESAEGGVVRLVTNENTGESQAYVGTVIIEDEISLIE
ncbi:MAG: hypothetical protein ABIH21_01585 [Patescibacteria group bacterium]